MTTGGGAPKRLLWGGVILFLGGFVGLCTLFAAVVTAVQAWQERERARWPELVARVDRCDLATYLQKRRSRSYYINCSIRYPVGSDEIVSRVSSRSTPAPDRVIWQAEPIFNEMQDWVNRHPRGTPMAVRYDPANPRRAALETTDMPLGGPQTPDNLRLVEVGTAGCLVLLAVGWIVWPRSSFRRRRPS